MSADPPITTAPADVGGRPHPTVTVVIVAYGPGPLLVPCVDAVLASTGVSVDVVIVDNGAGDNGAVDNGPAADAGGRDGGGVVAAGNVDVLEVRAATAGSTSPQSRVQIVRPGANTGFAQGCNLGAASARGTMLALVNPDVLVTPDALARLCAVAGEPDVGIATADLRLADEPDTMNSAGNPVHYTGLAWAGGHGEPADQHRQRRSVASASGACLVIGREFWTELGGFHPAYFAYHEDVELSLRCWLHGQSVEYVPEAVARHEYEFTRNRQKNYLLERNRLLTVLTIYSTRTLLILAPALLLVEAAVLAAATAQGWLPAKLRGYRWLLGHAGQVQRRRRVVQAARTLPDRTLVPLLAARLEPTNVEAPPGLDVLNVVLSSYWRLVRRWL